MGVDLVNAAIGLFGVLLGSGITLWGQSRRRAADYRDEVRRVYADWAAALLRLRRQDERSAQLLVSGFELEQNQPTDPRELQAWQAAYSSMMNELGATQRRQHEAQQLCEMSYSRIMYFDYSRQRKRYTQALHEKENPFIAASRQDGPPDLDVLDKEWERVSRKMGSHAEYVERTLRRESMLPWLRDYKESVGDEPCLAELERNLEEVAGRPGHSEAAR